MVESAIFDRGERRAAAEVSLDQSSGRIKRVGPDGGEVGAADARHAGDGRLEEGGFLDDGNLGVDTNRTHIATAGRFKL